MEDPKEVLIPLKVKKISSQRSPSGETRTAAGQAAEDYLKIIYELAGPEGRVTTSQIAARLGIRPASVTGMLQRLSSLQEPLVDYQKHRGVGLTAAGSRIAVEIIRHHRLLELYLQKVLGYAWDEVHQEADILEHFISEQFEERIARILDDPSTDPHGDPIPNSQLNFPQEVCDLRNMNNLRCSERAIIQRVSSSDEGILRDLSSFDLFPGTMIEITDYDPLTDTHEMRIIRDSEKEDARRIVLKNRVTTRILVYPVS